MTVLVAAASKHGATAGIAERIGASLRASGAEVEVRPIEDVGDLGRYEAFVLGSGVYLGAWPAAARRFLDEHEAELAASPTWLFASGPIVGDPPGDDDPQALRPGLAEALVEQTGAREHKLFAGRLDSSDLGFLERAAVHAAHATEGDWRDWAAVDDWAAGIARALQPSGRKAR